MDELSSSSTFVRSVRSTSHRVYSEMIEILAPVLKPLQRAANYAFGSFFRFMIVFGIVLLGVAAVLSNGTVAGHVGIYGFTSIVIGILGRLIIWWNTRDRTTTG